MNPTEAAAGEQNEPNSKGRWKVTYWAEYDRALVNRSRLTVWFAPVFVREPWRPGAT